MKEYIVKFFIMTLALLTPIKPMLIACGFLIFCDMITGILASRKRKERIKSSEMRRSISKFLVYQITIISAFILEIYMLDGLVPVSKVVAGVIGMVEFTSILENTSTIAGTDIVKLVLNKLGSKNQGK